MSAREVARDVVLAVDRDDAYANLLLPARIREAGLSPADAGFATELAYGTLRWQGLHDALIADAAGRPIDEIDPTTLATLRIGSHQLSRMRTPVHAAVHETVALLGKHKGRAGFANAVLRRLSEVPAEERLARLTGAMTDDDRLALETAHPAWVLRALRRSLDREGAAHELGALLAADNDPPAVQLVALPGIADAEPAEWGALGGAPTASPIGRVAPPGDPARLPQVADGSWRVQDAGSQLAALALTRARPVRAGERWLDLCAGPGGKAALMAAEAAAAGASLEANELLPHRARLVRDAVRGIRPRPDVVVGDGRRYGRGETAGAYDRVLLDAPCTGLGALRRRPEARWRKQPTDVPELAGLQSDLLEAASRAVAPGGLVAYVTCSPHLAETRAVVERAASLGLVPVDTRAVVRELSPGIALGETGDAVQLWPHRNGTDAMFMQLLTTA